MKSVLRGLFRRNGYWSAVPAFLALAVFAQNPPPDNRPTLGRTPQQQGDQDPAWKSKQIADWTEDDAKQVIADSPWVKTFTPYLSASGGQSTVRPRMGGISVGGIGIGMPGGRRMGGGYPGGYPPGGGYPGGQSDSSSLPRVVLRWESAMPIRSAELKARDNNAPVIDDKHYAIAVYGVPARFLVGETKKLEGELKKAATLRRDGKKDIKPSSVQIVDKPDGLVVVYEFSTSNEISKDDHRVEFNAKMSRLVLDQSFFLDDMVWQGKREL